MVYVIFYNQSIVVDLAKSLKNSFLISSSKTSFFIWYFYVVKWFMINLLNSYITIDSINFKKI